MDIIFQCFGLAHFWTKFETKIVFLLFPAKILGLSHKQLLILIYRVRIRNYFHGITIYFIWNFDHILFTIKANLVFFYIPKKYSQGGGGSNGPLVLWKFIFSTIKRTIWAPLWIFFGKLKTENQIYLYCESNKIKISN